MKNRTSFYLLAMLMASVVCLASCARQSSVQTETLVNAGTKTFCYKDSCRHLILSLSLEVPVGEDSASLQIRDSLIADFILNANCPNYGEDFHIKPYTGDMSDPQAIVEYYGKADYEYLYKLAESDYNERLKYLNEDTTLTDEERQERSEDVPVWGYDLNIKQITDTLGFVVYNSETYIYCGGAHGGVVGTGAMTFDKATGTKISNFILPDATKALQPLIRKGLIHYYGEYGETMTDSELSDRLQIEGTVIPQPRMTPFPNANGDSLIFTYGQYEIACYADGMPSFALSVKDLIPYLTPESKALLIRKNSPITPQ